MRLRAQVQNASRRLAQLALVLFGSTFLLALLLELLPVGLDDLYVTAFTEEDRQAQLAALGLDGNFFQRYWMWLANFVTGDLGSFVFPGAGIEPVGPTVAAAVPVSIQLIIYTQIFALAISIPLGIYTAYRAGTRADRAISYGLFTSASFPNFVLGLLFAASIGTTLGWLPPLGYVPFGEDPVEHIRHMILPVLALGIPLLATYTRLLRTDVIAALREDYVTMAVSKGLSNKRILFRHVFRPSSVTLFTSAALNMGALIGGTLVIENIFTIPGLGREIALAIGSRQFLALQSYIALIAVAYVFFNTVVDIAAGFIDPRTRARRN